MYSAPNENVEINAITQPFIPTNGSLSERLRSDHSDSSVSELSRVVQPVSPNIALTLWATFFLFTARSLWNVSVLSSYVFLLITQNDHDSNAQVADEKIGFITAVMGMTQLIVALPSGYLSDKWLGRNTMLRAGSVLGVIASVLTLFAVKQAHYPILCIALSVWGVFWGLVNTCLMALFADSMDHQSSKYFTQRLIVQRVAAMAGPFAALVMFATLGNHWSLENCAFVITAAQVVALPAFFLLWRLRDESRNNTSQPSDPEQGPSRKPSFSDGHSNMNTQRTVSGSEHEDCLEAELAQPLLEPDLIDTRDIGDRVVAVSVAFVDTTASFAAGMSIQFFPIFFMDNLRLTPTIVQLIYLVCPLGQIILAQFAQNLAKVWGRSQVTLLMKWIGVILMVAMIIIYQHSLLDEPNVSHSSTEFTPTQALIWLPFHLTSSNSSIHLVTPAGTIATCILFVLRTSFMNCTQALTKSMLMDAVPPNERGRWSALESLNSATWCGSAFLGGILVGRYGICAVFYTTSVLQLLASMPLLTLFCRVPPVGRNA